MSKNLQLGESFNITKESPETASLLVSVGWYNRKNNFKIFNKNEAATIDLDASAILLSKGRLMGTNRVINSENNVSEGGSVTHIGENKYLPEDTENISILLEKIPEDVDKILFVVNVDSPEEKGHNLGMLEDIFVRVSDSDSKGNGELVRIDVSCEGSTDVTLIVCELTKEEGSFIIEPILATSDCKDISELAEMLM